MRALASGETISFTRGKTTISVTHDKAECLAAAEIPADKVVQSGEIWHLVGDPLPAYQNLTIEQVVTKRLLPVKIDTQNIRDGYFYVLELADPTGKKANY